MQIVVIDDEPLMLAQLKNEVEAVFPDAEVVAFEDPEGVEAYLEEAPEGEPKYAFFDIKLRGMSGIELAKIVKDERPHTRIVFCTAYSDYALEAFSVPAQGYVLKPITRDKIKEAVRQIDLIAQEGAAKQTENGLVVRTFGNFEVFYDGVPVVWKRQKAKELLALIIDARGASLNNVEIAKALWDDDSKTSLNYVQTVMASLRKTLKEYGVEDILIKSWNATSIDKTKVNCDLYAFLNGDAQAVNDYHGEYMNNYDWAKSTKSWLSGE